MHVIETNVTEQPYRWIPIPVDHSLSKGSRRIEAVVEQLLDDGVL
jgi:hypothetical protein